MAELTARKKMSRALLPMVVTTAVFVVLPLVYIVVLSFLQRSEVWGVEAAFTFDNYAKMADVMYARVFGESFLVALLTTLLTLLLGYPFAYCTARLPARRRTPVLLLLVVPFWLNSLLRLRGWVILLQSNGVLDNLLRSLGLIDEPLKLMYTLGTTLLGMTYALIPMMILAIYNSVEKMDWSQVEAARDLGASPARAFVTVTLPQTLPGIIAGSVLVFVPSVGLFFISDLLGGSKTMLLGNLIKDQLLTARNWPFGAALSVMMLGLTTLLIMLYRRSTGDGSLRGML